MPFVVSAGALADLDRTPIVQARTVQLSDSVVLDYATIYLSQPQVRTVISFLARNIAQLPIHVYRRRSDTDRERLVDHALAVLLGRPNPSTTRYRLIDSLIHDLGIFDNAYWLKTRDARSGNAIGVLRVPPQIVKVEGDSSVTGATGYTVTGTRNLKRTFPADQFVHFRGHNPTDARMGASPVETLRRILAEEYMAAAYREQLWRNGARFGGYLRRPPDAPAWSPQARSRFRAEWQSQYVGEGPNAGGTPILEDGMEWVSGAGMTPEQAQYLEARKLTREEVAAAYHIPLPMVGILDHATFSNITEQHKQLYQDTLGPWLAMLAEEIELQLLPDLPDPEGVYVEWNLAEKLRGSFEEQATQLQASIGAPWLTRNEGRARMNLPAIEGGDELVTPLNVLIGGQASPQDSAPPQGASRSAVRKGLQVKAAAPVERVSDAEAVLTGFFDRQKRALLARLGAKAADLWDEGRWNDELADDLASLAVPVAAQAAEAALRTAGIEPGLYDRDRTVEWLARYASGVASGINGRTRTDVEAALAAADPIEAIRTLFEGTVAARAGQIAQTFVTGLSGFGTVEAFSQAQRTGTKTWVASPGARASHVDLDGQTVPLDDLFSNGARWPADSTLPDEERAGCSCDLEITVED